jgi:hypothetical protein
MPKNIEHTPQQNSELISDLVKRLTAQDIVDTAEALSAIAKPRDVRDAAAAIREAVEAEEAARLQALRAAKNTTPGPAPKA